MSAGGGEGDLNLTPMLDLFSTLICFLLLTAAWFQVEALSTNVENVTSSDSSTPQPNPEKKVQLVVTLLQNEIQMSEDEKSNKIPVQVDDKGILVTEPLKVILQQWRG